MVIQVDDVDYTGNEDMERTRRRNEKERKQQQQQQQQLHKQGQVQQPQLVVRQPWVVSSGAAALGGVEISDSSLDKSGSGVHRHLK
eukprot:scaffold12690_cov177-Cylindrotheca_fusiformis.AAC.4